MLVSYSLLDFMASVLPWAVAHPLWRSHATAELADSLLSVLLGLFAIFAAAVLLWHKRTLRVLAVVCGALAVVCVASLVTRALDYWDVRLLLTPQQAFDLGETSFVVNAKYMAALVLLFTLATIAWQASPRAWRDDHRGYARPRDIFPRSEHGPTREEPRGPEDLGIAEVEPADFWGQSADPGGGEAEPVFESFADEEDATVAHDERAHTGDLGLVDKEGGIEPVAPDGPEKGKRAVKADADVSERRRTAGDARQGRKGRRKSGKKGGRKPGRKGRRKPGKDPKTGAEIPAPPDDVLRSEVQALVDNGESLTKARRKVAGKYGIGVSTVRDRTR